MLGFGVSCDVNARERRLINRSIFDVLLLHAPSTSFTVGAGHPDTRKKG